MGPSSRGVANLERLRADIAGIDRALVALIRDRVRVARRIALAKEAGGLAVRDAAQEARVLRRAAALARRAGLSGAEVRRLFRRLIGLTRRAEIEE